MGHNPGGAPNDFTGRWMVPAGNTSFNSADVTKTLEFTLDNSAGAFDENKTYDLTITAYSKDGTALTQKTSDADWHLATNVTGSGNPLNPATVAVAAKDFTATEDTGFLLGDMLNFTMNDAVTKPDPHPQFSIVLSGLPENTEIEGMTKTIQNGETFWTASGTGDQSHLEALANSITITPPENWNGNANNAGNGNFHFDVKVTAYTTGGQNGKLYLQIEEPAQGTGGTLHYNGQTITASSVSGVPGITDGQYFVVDGVSVSGAGGAGQVCLTYSPEAHASGDVKITAHVVSKETGAANTETSTQSQTVTISPVNSGYDVQNITATGDEDTNVQLQITGDGLVDEDGSESIISAKLTGVPEGYLVYAGADASAPMASNIGNETWSIPLNGNELPDYIAVKAPENKSGTHTVNLKIYSGEEGETPMETTQAFTLTVNPVADGVTINPTNSVGVANNDVAVNLNPTMTDIDGSETATITLAGFSVGNNVTFNHGTATYDEGSDTFTITGITHAELGSLKFNTQYNVSNTITVTAKTVETDNQHTSGDVTATFDVSVVGGATYMPPPSPPAAPGRRGAAPEASDTYDGILTGSSDDDYISGSREEDSLYGKGGNDILNVIMDMEIIDLTGSGQQSITLDAAHVKAMTGDDNILLIRGDTTDDAGDTVNLENGWTDTGTTEEVGDMIYHILNNADDTAHLKIEDGVNYHIA